MTEHIIAFSIYSCIGATLEHMSYYTSNYSSNYSSKYSSKECIKCMSNPIITGFPLYGVGAYSIIYIDTILEQNNVDNFLVKFIIFGTIATLLELCVGLMVGAGPKSYIGKTVDAWDYTDEPLNLYGIISVRHFISWGILGLILSKVHPIIIDKILHGIK